MPLIANKRRKCALCSAPATSNRHRYCSTCRAQVDAASAARQRARKRARELASPRTMAERGYDRKHRRLRARYARELARGVPHACTRCGRRIFATDRWHLDHSDIDRSIHVGIACELCNVRAGARKSHRTGSSLPLDSGLPTDDDPRRYRSREW